MPGDGAQMNIPFMRLDRQFASIRDTIMPAIMAVLESGRVLQSPEIDRLEGHLAEMHGVKHCVATSSGTDALQFAIACLGLPEGSRVAVPTMTFVASASAIVHNGCRPVFVDADPETMQMDEDALLGLIQRQEVDAIVAVPLYGQLLELEEVSREARRHGIPLIEDAAQALGATRYGKPVGAHDDIFSLSFDPTKTIGAYGSGGAMLTDNDSYAETARLLRYHGDVGKGFYARPGFNRQMDSLQAAIIDVKLDYVDQWQGRRVEIARRFSDRLAEIQDVELLKTLTGNVNTFHKYVISVRNRDEVRQYLAAKGIQTRVHYPVPLHLQPCFLDGSQPVSLPNAESAAKNILSLPMYPELSDDEVDFIVGCVGEVCQLCSGV